MPRVVLDTNALFDRAALASLRDHLGDIVLPAVAFAERARQLRRQGRDVDELWGILERGRIRVESFGPDEALSRPLHAIPDAAWGRLARDAFIAGHVGDADVLWTRDVEDFVAVGLPRARIQDTAELA